MGTFTFRLPDIGEGIAEAEIVAWHVSIGDIVEEDGKVADLMTDKATVELESPVAGRVIEMAGVIGDVIAIGSPLVVLETEGGAAEEEDAPAPRAEVSRERIEAETPEAEDVSRAVEAAGQVQAKAAPPSTRPPTKTEMRSQAAARQTGARALASPAVRQRARELGIDLAEIRSAEGGRIRHADLDAFLSYGTSKGYAPAGKPMRDEAIRVIGLRKRIAENMAASKRAIPHFTYIEEVDLTELEKVRADLNDNRGSKPKLTLLPLLIAALCRALPQYPMLNARYDDEQGVVSRSGVVHLGMATQTEAGLLVPVIRDAQGKNLWQLASEILRLSEAARSGKARGEELSGSTITITSLGPLGGIASTPVINRPEVAIIGPNRIVERPMFVSDGMGSERIEKRKLMNISISCDHRVVDGYDAASFVQAMKRLLETPILLLAD
jgi:2-oxoisovalerate dehydrogenase E2 component (dihydrolipoyl transacylase)